MKGYFCDDDNYTQLGTAEILNYYSDSFDFVDVQKDKWFQKYDIDFICVSKKDKNICTKVEIKCDRHTTDNIYLETVSNSTKNIKGWTLTSQSDFIFYFYTETKALYIFRTSAIREWIGKNINAHRFGIAKPVTNDWNGKYMYSGMGLVVPVNVLISELGNSNSQTRKLA